MYSGATGVGKFGPFLPRQSGDAGIRSIETIRNSTSYVSGSYTVALVKELARVNLQALSQTGARDLMVQGPSPPARG